MTAHDEGQKPPPKYSLVWETGHVALGDGDNVIGRAPDADVWIDAPGVSRHHARLRLEGSAAILEDLGSKNGSFVRGQRVIAPSNLTDGDEIRLGPVVVTFRILIPAASTVIAPEAQTAPRASRFRARLQHRRRC